MTARTGKGRYRRTVAAAARDRRAAELHGMGWSYQAIAAELGFASRGHAHDAVMRAFADIPAEGAEQARQLDLDRIDRLIEQAWQVMLREHVATSGGKVVEHEGGPLRDDGPVLAAVGVIARLLERRARVYGYDAPAASRLDIITSGAIEAEIARLTAELDPGNGPG